MKNLKPLASKKPPQPDASHERIDEWIADAKPSLNPIVEKLDQLIRKELIEPRYAVKWGKAYYGSAHQGWCIELVAYDVSINAVFLNGSQLDKPPELGGETRYVKIHSMEDLKSAQLQKWIKQSCRMSGWAW